MKGVLKHIALGAWLPVVLVALIIGVSHESDSVFFPPAEDSFRAVWLLLSSPVGWGTLGSTVFSSLAGFVFGGVGGVLVGTLIGHSPVTRNIFQPFVSFWRATPGAAMVPLVIAIAGIGGGTVIAAVSLIVFFSVALVTSEAVSRVSAGLVDSLRVMGFNKLEIAFRGRLPTALPAVLTGLQNGLQMSLPLTVLLEVLVGGGGLGGYLMNSLDIYKVENLWAGIILLGLLSAMFNILFQALEKGAFPWLSRTRLVLST